ncbi:hypothetical protein BJG94_16715 [Rhizobium sp. Td3]|nr:hypothetical protein [Rhizobium sp. RM]TMV17609.1 hypothetical protein BJG94_16715 [Rhizobium sp. Td3]
MVAVSDAIFAITRKHGGIFWGEHGKGLRGAYLRDWIAAEAYSALQGIKAAFDPEARYNPGKLVTNKMPIMGIATTPFRAFNGPEGDPLSLAFRCNGNAQCLSYAKTTPMCPSFKATADIRYSPNGRADALRTWHKARREADADLPVLEKDDGDIGQVSWVQGLRLLLSCAGRHSDHATGLYGRLFQATSPAACGSSCDDG